MSIRLGYLKILKKLRRLMSYYVFQYPRILKYKILSDCNNIVGKPQIIQPVQLLGEGKIEFGKNVKLGVSPSKDTYNGYGYINAERTHSRIVISDNVWINNNCMIMSIGNGIEIGEKTLVGLDVEIIDSDFHELHPERRIGGTPNTASVKIGKNVLIGSNVKILKGVTIGDNSVIANSSVVVKPIPSNVIAAGNPCKVIKNIDFN